jgi:hypothetical protein
MKIGIQTLPPKTAAMLAERARRMDGCVRVGTSGHIYEFAQGNSVVCLISLDPPVGHVGRDPHRAEQIRKELAHA